MRLPAEALRAIRQAMRRGSWLPDPHLLKRIAQRGLTLADVVTAVKGARRIEPHGMLPLNPGGESWRVHGRDADHRMLGVGVELVGRPDGDLVVVITAFVED